MFRSILDPRVWLESETPDTNCVHNESCEVQGHPSCGGGLRAMADMLPCSLQFAELA